MNKIFGFLLLAAGCLFTASCSDDSTDYVAPSTLKVLKSNTYFTADADTSVVVTATPIIEASTEATWLKAEIKGDSVQLSTQVNDNLTSRSTQLVLKDAKGAIVTLSVTQEGSVFGVESDGNLITNDAASTTTYKLVSNKTTTATTSGDWIQASISPKAVTITLSENTTGKPRVGYVKVVSGTLKDSIKVVQASLNDFVGKYTLVAQVSDKGELKRQESEVEIVKVSEDSVSLVFDNQIKWGGKYKAGGKLTFNASETLLTVPTTSGANRYLKSVLLSSDGQATFSPSASVDLLPANSRVLAFEANGSTDLTNAHSFGFGLFNSAVADNSNFVGFYALYFFPYMIAQ